jgi:phosphohistidine phosphatase SixA
MFSTFARGMKTTVLLCSAMFTAVFSGWVAEAAASDDEAWAAMARPGTAAIMRHALAPGTGDPAELKVGDCSTQRNLDERGRAQARRIGAALRERGITFDRVLTSQWCRCRETAELLDVGPVEEFPALNSFFRDRSTRDAQTREARTRLMDLVPGEKVMVVTHQVNISALTGEPTASGEMLVLGIGAGGAVDVLGEILIRPE